MEPTQQPDPSQPVVSDSPQTNDTQTNTAPLDQMQQPAGMDTSQPPDLAQQTYNPEQPAASTVPPTPAPKSHKKRWLIVGSVILVIIIAASLFYILTRHAATKPTTIKAATSSSKSQPTKAVALKADFNYLDTEKSVGDLQWFTDLTGWFGTSCADPNAKNCTTPLVTPSDISYAQIGTTSDGKPVIVASWGGGDQGFSYVAIQNSANTYTLLARVSGLDTSTQNGRDQISDLQKHLSTNVSLDTATLPSEFTFPTSISLKGINLQTAEDQTTSTYIKNLSGIRGPYFGTTIASKDIIPLGTDKSHAYYVVTVTDAPNYQLHEMYGAISTHFSLPYYVNNGVDSDTKAAAITWSDGTKNSVIYTSRNPGCGSANGYLVAKNVSDNDLTSVGKLSDGTPIYQLPSNSPLLQEEYTTDYAKGSNIDDSKLKNLTLAQFQAMHGLIVTKNALGEYAIHLRSDMFLGGGCGKPVIYLYPQQAEMVNVGVGANITASDPYYPQGGWRNVFALPDSRLLYQGKGYGSLFWEGKGYGEYPIVQAGTVVRSDQAVATIKQQLAEQGFNAKETSDFLAYWQPRLPHTPYVRLTWLSTDQMNQLAPLAITPKPQTVIRAFLQFNGLDQPVSLPAQHFTAPARNGFTVTEWGGLLR